MLRSKSGIEVAVAQTNLDSRAAVTKFYILGLSSTSVSIRNFLFRFFESSSITSLPSFAQVRESTGLCRGDEIEMAAVAHGNDVADERRSFPRKTRAESGIVRIHQALHAADAANESRRKFAFARTNERTARACITRKL
jgi:hypothetical protein